MLALVFQQEYCFKPCCNQRDINSLFILLNYSLSHSEREIANFESDFKKFEIKEEIRSHFRSFCEIGKIKEKADFYTLFSIVDR